MPPQHQTKHMQGYSTSSMSGKGWTCSLIVNRCPWTPSQYYSSKIKKHVRGYLYANAKQQSKYFSRQRTNHALFLMRMFSVHGFLVRAHLISIMQILKTYTHRKQLFHFIYQRNPTLTPRNNNPFWNKLEYITPINHYKFTKAFVLNLS